MKTLEIAFSRSSRYGAMLPRRIGRVCEERSRHYGFAYTERHLQCVWYDDAWRPSILHSVRGAEVRVRTPGRWNMEAGPDFLDAVLDIGGEKRRICGDVEIHIHPSDWRTHGHSDDPRYARVVAHVSYYPAPLPAKDLPPGAIQIFLQDDLLADPFFSLENLDTSAYPYAERGRNPPCAKLLAQKPVDYTLDLLESAGEARLRSKAERMSLAMEEKDMEQVLYEETLCALGYKHNRAAFRQLAQRLPVSILREESGNDPTIVCALLLGVSGLLPAQPSSSWERETRAYVRQLWDIWWKKKSEWAPLIMSRGEWSLSGLRPPNHPIRRIVAAAALFTCSPAFIETILALTQASAASWVEDMTSFLTSVPAGTYWNRRLALAGSPQEHDVGLIGASRASAILANVIVPFLAACGKSTRHYAEILRLLPPDQENSIVRLAAHVLLGRDHNPKLYRTSLRQQGLIQIFHDFCLNDRSGCQSCPLPAALLDCVRDPTGSSVDEKLDTLRE